MKRLLKSFSIFLAVVLLLSCLSGCGEKSDVKKMLGEFEASCQKLDAEGMMDCLNPSIVNPLRSLFGFFGSGSLDSMLNGIIDAIGLIDLGEYSPQEVMKTFSISPKEIEMGADKTSCSVTASVEYSVNGKTTKNEMVFNCELIDGNWYIVSIR